MTTKHQNAARTHGAASAGAGSLSSLPVPAHLDVEARATAYLLSKRREEMTDEDINWITLGVLLGICLAFGAGLAMGAAGWPL